MQYNLPLLPLQYNANNKDLSRTVQRALQVANAADGVS